MTMPSTLSPWRSRPVVIGIAIAALCAGVLCTVDGKKDRLYCMRCGAVRQTTDFEVFGVWVSGSDRIHKTRLSRWIEAHRYPACTHRWTAGYADGLWSRACHRGNLVDRLATWGDDPMLIEAIDRRQSEVSGFVDRLVDSLGDYDAESHDFLVSVRSDEIKRRSSDTLSIPIAP